MNNGRTLRALQKAEDMKKQAFEDKHDYGSFLVFVPWETFIVFVEMKHWLRNTIRKLWCICKSIFRSRTLQHFTRLSSDIIVVKKEEGYDKALELAEKGIREAKTSGSRIGVMREKCQVLYWMRRDDEFRLAMTNVCVR